MFEGLLGNKARAFLFVIGAISIWLIWSLEPMLSNEPIRFQAAGSIIVAWSIFSFGRDKILREKSISTTENNAIISEISRLRNHLEFSESLAENTANSHTLQHYQLLKSLGMTYPTISDLDQEIKILEDLLADKEHHSQQYEALKVAHNSSIHAIKRSKIVRKEQEPWIRLLTKLELFFAIFGTLQWGYGNVWIEILHNEIVSNLPN